jgi:hypothetical protein
VDVLASRATSRIVTIILVQPSIRIDAAPATDSPAKLGDG